MPDLHPDLGLTLLRGILAAWLIALMLWMIPVAKTAHLWAIVIVSWLVGRRTCRTVIAGAMEAFYLSALGEQEWGEAPGGFILAALIGNGIGGTGLAAALDHAQAVTGARG